MGEKKEKIEIKRIIKAFVDAQWLYEFDLRLAEYKEYAGISDNDTEEEDD